MAQFIFATESYPLLTDIGPLLSEQGDSAILVSKDVHHKMSAEHRSAFSQIVEVPAFDLPTLQQAITAHVKLEPGARLVSHDDFFYEVLAELATSLGLVYSSLESLRPFVNKDVTKQRLRDSGIRIPEYVMFDGEAYARDPAGYVEQVSRKLRFPIFAKPIYGAGAENTELISEAPGLHDWCARHVGEGNYELDEFIGDAVLYHCDSMVQGGRVLFTQVCRYLHPCADFARGAVLGSYTIIPDEEVDVQLRQFTSNVIEALGRHHPVPDGITHMEVFRRASGELIFLEVQHRPPGAGCQTLFQQHLGTTLEPLHFQLQMGKQVKLPSRTGPYAAFMYFPTADGTVQQLNELPALKSELLECHYYIRPGQKTTSPRSILEVMKRGVVALSISFRNPNHQDFMDDVNLLVAHRPYTMDP